MAPENMPPGTLQTADHAEGTFFDRSRNASNNPAGTPNKHAIPRHPKTALDNEILESISPGHVSGPAKNIAATAPIDIDDEIFAGIDFR